MQLGFVSAILPDLSLEEVVAFAASEGFACVELMCWPRGKADRRYAGVTHVDVTDFGPAEARRVLAVMQSAGVAISGLGYYPNLLAPDEAEAGVYAEHLRKVVLAAEQLGVGVVNTFVGRDPWMRIDEQWPRMLDVWRPIVAFAEEHRVRIGIENCPMLFTGDEWPGGKNLAHSPAIWRHMFADLPSPAFGLNYDPSHLVWQQIEHVKPLEEFAERIVHVHLKDVLVDAERLGDVGVLAAPLDFHQPRIPGRGMIDWPRFLAALRRVGYTGAACIEVEDREFEGSLAGRQEALRRSAAHIRRAMEDLPA